MRSDAAAWRIGSRVRKACDASSGLGSARLMNWKRSVPTPPELMYRVRNRTR